MTRPVRRPSAKFRLAPSAALFLLGMVLAVVAANTEPGPRLSRRAALVDLIRREDQRARTLRGELDRLAARLEALEERSGARGLDRLRARIAALAEVAGLAPVAGPGVVVTLRDSTLRRSPTGDPNDLVIHEQDLQAVVNAMWSAGAEAVSINGERITGASAVRCVGNTLLLHGSVYAPPYVVAAVGDPGRLRDGLERDPLVERFRVFAEEFRLGFEARAEGRLSLPGARGVVLPMRAPA